MKRALFPLLAVAVMTLTGCFPRQAHYDSDPAPYARGGEAVVSGIAGFDPTRGPFTPERLTTFIMATNPFLTPADARREADAILKQANAHGVPAHLVVSLIATESSFNPRAVSPVGAQGLGQLMPATARDMGINDPFDIEQNIYATARYMAWLGKVWESHPRRWELALASYLAGVGTVSKQVKAGRDLTQEQTAYVQKIFRLSGKV